MTLIAKEENSEYIVADCCEMFPNTSFPDTGPTEEWLQENGCYPVSVYKDYDPETQVLVPCTPYLENGIVFTVNVAEKPVDVEDNN